MEQKIIEKMLIMVDKAIINNDIPIACIIIKDNKIIASDYNKKYLKNDPTAHAEILTIKKACKKLKRTNLSDCILYTTMYPCDMCNAVINEVRIKKVYYILNKEKNAKNTISYEQKFEKYYTDFNKKIKTFFYNKR